MVSLKELEKEGVQIGSYIEVNNDDKYYVISLDQKYLGFEFDIQTARAAINSQWHRYAQCSLRTIESFKVLKKKLGPVTKKELLDFGVDEGSRLEVLLSKSKISMGYVAKLSRKTLYLVNPWDGGAKKQADPCTETKIPYKNIRYYTKLETDMIK